MGRSPCCEKVGLKKGTWTAEEDQKLLSYIERHGHGSWRALPAKAGLQRCGKSCRLRWINYLRPDIKRGKFSLEEERTIIQLHALLGNRWSAIASHLPKRTDNEIKNHWNTNLKKRLTKMGIDPSTHKPMTSALGSGQHKDAANLGHMAQWESARLEAESRIVRESKLLSTSTTPYHSHLGPPAQVTVLNKVTDVPLVQPLKSMVSPCLDILKAWQETWTTTKSIPTTNAFFSTSNGSLQFPTSTLHFSDNLFTMSQAPGLICDDLPFNSTNNYEARVANNLKYFGKPIDDDQPEIGARMEYSKLMDSKMQLINHDNDIQYDPNIDQDNLRPPNFVVADDGYNLVDNHNPTGLYQDLDCSLLGGDLEDNKIYWVKVLNVETSALDSPFSKRGI
ncbi:hypothetical protein ACH5RR_030505 [Cinchona calisaya]|uniref:Uncharacterized protein n=1 Tax=Cinchona calisaya TaxID=153742 RepID=A0ABD2YXS1_9GENT